MQGDASVVKGGIWDNLEKHSKAQAASSAALTEHACSLQMS
jgi:hypothetical protein